MELEVLFVRIQVIKPTLTQQSQFRVRLCELIFTMINVNVNRVTDSC